MLHSKKHTKTPPEKPVKKYTKLSPFTAKELNARIIKISFITKKGNTDSFLKHVNLIQKLHSATNFIKAISNKRHELLRTSAISDLTNADVYKNHFDLHQVPYGKSGDTILNIVIQEYDSVFKLEEIKRQLDLIKFLQDQSIKVTDHEWKPEDWNTSIMGIIPQYAPTYFSKEYVYHKMLKLGKQATLFPEFKVRQIRIADKLLGRRMVLQVYAIEVCRNNFYQANKAFLERTQSPEKYVTLRMQRVNKKAWKSAIALTAQIQNDSRMIMVNNVTAELFFILETQLQSVSDVIGFYHDNNKQVIKIIVHTNDFKLTRTVIQQSLQKWNDMLDPSDTRISGNPTLIPITLDNYSESENSQRSSSIDSLLSLDLTAFTIFQSETTTEKPTTEPISDVTTESYKATIQMQNEKIGKQEAQIEFLIQTIQQLNADMNHKFERMLQLITYKLSEAPATDDTSMVTQQEDSINLNNILPTPEPTSQASKKQKVSLSSNPRH